MLDSGDSFGEIAIIRNVKRTLTVKVLSDTCKLLVMSRDSFTRVLGSIEDKLPMDYDQDRAQKELTPEPVVESPAPEEPEEHEE